MMLTMKLYNKSIICLLVVAALVNNCQALVQVTDRTLLVDGTPFLMKGVAYNPIPIGLSKFYIRFTLKIHQKCASCASYYTPFVFLCIFVIESIKAIMKFKEIPRFFRFTFLIHCVAPDQKNDYYTSSAVDVAVWQRDVQILKNMGANTVRLYGWNNSLNHTQFLDALLQNGIRVVLQYWFPSSNDISDAQTRANLISGFTSMVNNYKYHPAIIMWLFGMNMNPQNLMILGRGESF